MGVQWVFNGFHCGFFIGAFTRFFPFVWFLKEFSMGFVAFLSVFSGFPKSF